MFSEVEDGSMTVLSRKISSGFSLFTSFSYILIIFGVLLLMPIGFQQIQTGISFRNIKLNVKIQIGMICLIMLTLGGIWNRAVSL
ncbi:MAG: hypothetical protein IPO32_19305 [Crocinitomicaceae bacterium]|nr:hypothetical protein [Crocinitomicaceae bacterium]